MQQCRRFFLSGSVFLILVLVCAGQEEPARQPIPDAKVQARVEALIVKELFKDELAKASDKDPVARARLANTFLSEGRDTNDNLAGRYVFFRLARDLAAQAGDAPGALQAIDDIAKDFRVSVREVLHMKIKALMTASKAVANAEAYYTVVDSALILMEESINADDYEAALKLVATAENAARKIKSVPLVSSIRRRQDEVVTLQKNFAPFQPFADKLATDPKDPQANTEMGKYHALRKGNWDLGLVLLSRGNHPGLRYLATLDLSQPKDAASQIKMAEGWLLAVGQAPPPSQTHLLLRAYHWYLQALYNPELKERVRVEKAMQAIMNKVPAEYRVGEIVAEYRRYEGHFGPVYAVALSPDGRKAVSGGADNTLRLWDTKMGKEIRRFEGHAGRIWTVAFSPDGRSVASAGFDATIRIWDLASGREKRLAGHKDYVRSLVFSPTGQRILSGGDDRLVRLWDVASGNEIQTFKGHDHFVWGVAIAHDGKYVLSASLDKTVRLWHVASGQELKKLTGHKDTVLCVAFSPDSRRALSGSTDGTLKLWDLETGKEIHTFKGHKGYVHSVAFSPDGRRALSAGADHTVRLWDVPTGEEVRKLEGHRDQVWTVTFSRDGRLALSGGQDHTVRVWGGAK